MVDGKMRAVKGFFTTTRYLWLVLLLGLAVRLYALSHLYVINTDSVYYLYQARAVSEGMWDAAKSCGYTYISLYTFIVVLFENIFGDWMLSAQAVSITFGVLAIVPLYALMKRFFPDPIAALVALAFALNPFFVKESVDVMRDPVSWFLAMLGMFFFVKASKERKNALFFASSLSFCLAGLTRVEMLFLFAGSVLFLLVRREKNIWNIATFSFPLIGIALMTLVSFVVSREDQSLWSIYIFPRIETISFYLGLYKAHYGNITAKLTELNSQGFPAVPSNFFAYVRMNLWLVALGIVMSKLVSAAYFPFAALAVLGLKRIRERMREQPFVRYLLFLAVFSFAILYMHTFMTWVMERRYVAVALFPALVLVGFGMQRSLQYLGRKGLKEGVSVLLLFLMVLAVTVPGNIKPVRKDKLPYRQIGEFIAADAGGRITRIATSSVWVPFYAHAGNREVVCPKPPLEYRELPLKSYPQLIEVLKREGMEYFLWEEDRWRGGSYDFLQVVSPDDMKEVGSWTSRGQELILFKMARIQSSPP